ncbi:1-deoxy-D-xylulose-5-phosphate reductoisomerase [Desulfohalobium retbaense]|uniref:1-deoxy-D-xylulose 5-phosphate reductoisomerase n=1 Tax=Desulfohalobium retbaense (strain ATCC 49708 / DSM 5692 / JCM 16813 / HR100) TaxID=485915 RepID=C8X4K8_DESRD|nr:1-deoxy-D-xylulose-5-phosphate reductoisomerase [Desulfohalobium retbaense]ACV69231.1 1-deoxy-D-xylulose 5-phosphate reductoisomerase [Desulfohalobium retbaense DSM 5692]
MNTSATYISRLDPAPSTGPRKVIVLGSTGSIGCSALKVLAQHPDTFEVLGLAGATNANLLAEQARQWRPSVLGVLDDTVREEVRHLLPADYRPQWMVGNPGYQEMAALSEAELVLCAQVGAAGLPPTLAAVKAGKIVALANKESLVLAGTLVRELCTASGACLLPVDSEHNAMFQALAGHDPHDVRKFVLTASGGPFRGRLREELRRVTPDQALAHPNWSMGAKISIDSSTLMNKGLECIEAAYLFGVDMDRIEVVVHPESIIHSLVEYRDGSLLGHLGVPDMQIPIAHCLSYPNRLDLDLEPLDLTRLSGLHFEKPDESTFPCLALAREALANGPSFPIVLNAANEIAVDLFLRRELAYLDIARLLERTLQAHTPSAVTDLESIHAVDDWARKQARSFAAQYFSAPSA